LLYAKSSTKAAVTRDRIKWTQQHVHYFVNYIHFTEIWVL